MVVESRYKRWASACRRAIAALDRMGPAAGDFAAAAAELSAMWEEYRMWSESHPESFLSTTTAGKLEAVVGLDLYPAESLPDAIRAARAVVEGARALNLPKAFERG